MIKQLKKKEEKLKAEEETQKSTLTKKFGSERLLLFYKLSIQIQIEHHKISANGSGKKEPGVAKL